MNPDYISIISDFRQKVLQASKEFTKKEHFKDLLHRLFGGKPEVDAIIDSISAGAEYTILSIPKEDKMGRGSADTFFNNIIIEFENDLKKTGNHAKRQLAGYLLGQFRQGEGYNYSLMASDFINWKVYYIGFDQIPHLGTLNESELILHENEEAGFTLSDDNQEDFYYWIDRFLFRESRQKATLKRVELAFGYKSVTFIACYRIMQAWFQEAKKFDEVQVGKEQWQKFMEIAYGQFDGTDEAFLIHTYLSVFSKLLAFSVVSGSEFIEEKELKGILSGQTFKNYNLVNFVEDDFFHWVFTDVNFRNLVKVFRIIAQQISLFDFSNVEEDVLKGVYQELIDLDTRHALGEYYTPDWLCERIVQEFDFSEDSRILDPSCGSGSFLRAAIHRMQFLHPGIPVEKLAEAVYGIDIHPLSVQIAKTTLLISLGEELSGSKKPVRLNVLLANTLLSPDSIADLFGDNFTLQIDRQKKKVDISILDDPKLYDDALDLAEYLAHETTGKQGYDITDFTDALAGKIMKAISSAFVASFYEIYLGLKKVKEEGRDSIWKFILSNTYKPVFMKEKFDYVIGNPPWFTFASIKNEQYQNELYKLAVRYNVKPEKAKNMPHLEIAAIFMAHSASYFLRDTINAGSQLSGKLAFVLPRSFFSADQHNNIRSGKANGFSITEIWDLNEVQPLFNIPSCVFFAKMKKITTEIPEDGLPGLELKGRVPSHNCNWAQAKGRLVETSVIFNLAQLGKSTAFTKHERGLAQQANPYKNLFKQGATIVPRAFYFVEIFGKIPPDYEDRIIPIHTSKHILTDTKAPWKGIELSGPMQSCYMYYTAIARSVLPYCIFKPELIAIPFEVVIGSSGEKKIVEVLPKQMIRKGHLEAHKWFKDCENFWEKHRTGKSSGMTSLNRVNFHNGLTSQNLNTRYIVLYNASGKDANAGVLDRTTLNANFIVESTTYVYNTNNELEAHYLVALLNSGFANSMIKDFQAAGLFGPRHVHKKILDVYFPKFDENNALHTKIGLAGKQLSEQVKLHLTSINANNLGGALALGKIRTEIKTKFELLITEMQEMIEEIISGS